MHNQIGAGCLEERINRIEAVNKTLMQMNLREERK